MTPTLEQDAAALVAACNRDAANVDPALLERVHLGMAEFFAARPVTNPATLQATGVLDAE